MNLTLKQRISAAARSRSLERNPCMYRGETLRREKKSCCGTVEIFQCSERKIEVWHTKCRTCEFFTEMKG